MIFGGVDKMHFFNLIKLLELCWSLYNFLTININNRDKLYNKHGRQGDLN